MSAKLYVETIVFTGEAERPFIVRGQPAKALIALVNGGDRGVTAMEVANWADRFAAYCFELHTWYGNGSDRGATALEAATWAYRLAAYCHELRKQFVVVPVQIAELVAQAIIEGEEIKSRWTAEPPQQHQPETRPALPAPKSPPRPKPNAQSGTGSNSDE